MLVFLLIRSWNVVSYPIACYFPAKDFCNDKIQESLSLMGFPNKEKVSLINDTRLLKSAYLATKNVPMYKEVAALRLAEIFADKRNLKEARRYLDYVFLQDPHNQDAQRVLRKIKE